MSASHQKQLELSKQFITPRRISQTLGWVVVDIVILIIAQIVVILMQESTFTLDAFIKFEVILNMALVVVTLAIFRVYSQLWSSSSGHSAISIIISVGLASVVSALIVAWIYTDLRAVMGILVVNALSLSAFVAARYRTRLFSNLMTSNDETNKTASDGSPIRVLIIGAGDEGQSLARRINERHETRYYNLVGFIDDDPNKHNLFIEGYRVLGSREKIEQVVKNHEVNLIVMAIHNIDDQNFRDILEHCEHTEARIKALPNILEFIQDRHNINFLRDIQPEDLLGRSQIRQHESIDMSPVRKKRILVTGAAGSIGSELTRQLCNYEPLEMIMVDMNESALHDLHIELKTRFPKLSFTPVLVDVTQVDMIESVFETFKPDVVFHAAAYKHVPLLETYTMQAIKTNVGGTYNVARLAGVYQVERFVLISTDKAVNPSSTMGASKRACEMIVTGLAESDENRKTLYTAVRFGNVLGSRGSVVPTFTRQIEAGGPITVTHPDMTRYFMSIAEAANLVVHAACMTNGSEIFLLRMGQTVKILELAERMVRLRGMRPYIDIPITFSGIRSGEKLHEQLYDGSAENAHETNHPGIIRLQRHNLSYQRDEFWQWIHSLIANPEKFGKEDLMWGLTPSEEYMQKIYAERN